MGRRRKENYTCEDAAKNIVYACEGPDSNCYREGGGVEWCFEHTLRDCQGYFENESWPQKVIDCWAQGCEGEWCH